MGLVSLVALSSYFLHRRNRANKAQQTVRRVDHPFVAWLLENGLVVSLAYVRAFYMPTVIDKNRIGNMLVSLLLGGFVMVEGAILVQKILIEIVYAHRRWFNAKQRAKPSYWEVLKDWFTCNLVTAVTANGFATYLLCRVLTERLYARVVAEQSAPFRLVPFLCKLSIVRITCDITFYSLHRLLHVKGIYHRLHKRHHEHHACALATNVHFNWFDLLLEGFVPLYAGLQALSALSLTVNSFEQALLATYMQWYEIGSHSGKYLPTLTYMPPLAPIYQLVCGVDENGHHVDETNIRFHETHHGLVKCNYGITQWIDALLGSRRIK